MVVLSWLKQIIKSEFSLGYITRFCLNETKRKAASAAPAVNATAIEAGLKTKTNCYPLRDSIVVLKETFPSKV